MAVTPDDVRHVARLARLALPEERLAQYVGQLNGILAHMEALASVPPTAESTVADEERPGIAMRLRADDLGSVPLERAPAEFAPAMRDGFFLVPRLATHEDGEES